MFKSIASFLMVILVCSTGLPDDVFGEFLQSPEFVHFGASAGKVVQAGNEVFLARTLLSTREVISISQEGSSDSSAIGNWFAVILACVIAVLMLVFRRITYDSKKEIEAYFNQRAQEEARRYREVSDIISNSF